MRVCVCVHACMCVCMCVYKLHVYIFNAIYVDACSYVINCIRTHLPCYQIMWLRMISHLFDCVAIINVQPVHTVACSYR